MPPTLRTKVVSVHRLRRTARKRERELQAFLAVGQAAREPWPPGLPTWAEGVRVEKAGPFQFAVVASEWRGH